MVDTGIMFDPRDPAFRANPYPTYHALRRHDPIYYRADRGHWLITRYRDVVALAKDARLGFPRQENLDNGMTPPANRFLHLRQESRQLLRLWLVNLNPPDHPPMRKILHGVLSPAQVATLRQAPGRAVGAVAELGRRQQYRLLSFRADTS